MIVHCVVTMFLPHSVLRLFFIAVLSNIQIPNDKKVATGKHVDIDNKLDIESSLSNSMIPLDEDLDYNNIECDESHCRCVEDVGIMT